MEESRVEPYGFEEDYDYDKYITSVLKSIQEVFWDNAIGLSVKGSVTALLILHSLF